MDEILAIVPYPGLKEKIEKNFKKLSTIYPNLKLKLRIEIANLSNKKQLQQIISSSQPSIILSRGGTVNFIKKHTNITVIDIGISQYDIIRTIKTIPNIKKTGIICYPAFDQSISDTLAQFNIDIEKIVVNKKVDIRNAISYFLDKGYENILCDSGIIINSYDYQLSSYLIESGDEVINHALETCFLILLERQDNHNYYELLTNYLKISHKYTLFSQDNNFSKIVFSSDKNKSNFLAKKIRKAIKSNNRILRFDKQKWHLIIKKTDKYFIANIDSLGADKENNSHSYDQNYIPIIYSICHDKHFFNLINYYATSSLPLSIVSSPGLEPEYLLDLISQVRNQKYRRVNISNEKKLINLITNQSSPFFDNNNLLVITNMEKLNFKNSNIFFKFLLDSNLATRNKIVFLNEQTYGTKINITFPKSLHLNQIILDPLNTVSYDKFNLLVHSIFNRFNLIAGKTFTGISDTALDRLTSYSWSNNYQEFIQVLLTLMKTSPGPILKGTEVEDTLQHFALIEKAKPTLTTEIVTHKDIKNKTLHDIIVDNVKSVLAENNDNKTKTAQQLNISRATLWRYLKQ